ncbi:hypothetical protein DZF91_33545 [Actinomadura logoneensis]|uniref:Acyl-CoA dehydrogenase n=1 Tax=Actinomadura logoneensis TaxID=2293572 RepID=A0A372JBL8_9ACTN|nr:hypothetical protein [Actinomadura logoneensis]RFU37309.1 hypothetical protein DZF91_33545 [Actinomadura logoneensis]
MSGKADTVRGLLAELLADGRPNPADVPSRLLEARDGLGFPDAAAVLEHTAGVLPLLDLFGASGHPLLDAVRRGGTPCALALFTPGMELSPRVPAVHGRAAGVSVVLSGRYRYGSAAAEAALVQIGCADGLRLCLVAHDHPALAVGGGGGAAGGWGWAEAADAEIDARLVSPPVTWDAGSPLVAALDAYTWSYLTLAVAHATSVVAGLRRVLAVPDGGAAPLSGSQHLAHELSRLDIELSLLADLARLGPRLSGAPATPTGAGVPSSPTGAHVSAGVSAAAALAACTRLTRRTARIADDFAAEFGLPGGPSWADAAHAHFGGPHMAESELARRMGLLEGRS